MSNTRNWKKHVVRCESCGFRLWHFAGLPVTDEAKRVTARDYANSMRLPAAIGLVLQQERESRCLLLSFSPNIYLTPAGQYTKIRIMQTSTEWRLEFYLEANGSSPVEEFLDRLDVKTRARFRWSMEQLRLRNVQAREPLVRHLEGDLWELREESSTNIYRIIYFFFTGRRIVFVHGFQKKTQRTPRRELELAARRYQEFLARAGRRS